MIAVWILLGSAYVACGLLARRVTLARADAWFFRLWSPSTPGPVRLAGWRRDISRVNAVFFVVWPCEHLAALIRFGRATR